MLIIRYYCNSLPITLPVLKNQGCNIYEYRTYNRKPQVPNITYLMSWHPKFETSLQNTGVQFYLIETT